MFAKPLSTAAYAGISALVVILDQISKLLIVKNFQFMERHAVIPGFFDLTLVYNPGAAFSFLADAGGWQKFFFLALALVIGTFLERAIVKRLFAPVGLLGAAMIIGGAMGNVIDRLVYGHVVDFILVYYHHWFYPAFNIADSFICVGVALLIWENFTASKRAQQAA